MIDLGGTNAKLTASRHQGFRKVPSARKFTPKQLVKGVKQVGVRCSPYRVSRFGGECETRLRTSQSRQRLAEV